MNNRTIQTSLVSLMEYLLCLLLILSQQSVYWLAESIVFRRMITYSMLGIAFVLFVLSVCKLASRTRNELTVALLLDVLWILAIVPVLVSSYVHNEMSIRSELLYTVFPLFLFPFIYYNVKIDRISMIISKFIRITMIITVISLIFWALSLIGLSPNMSMVIHWGGFHAVPGFFGIHFLAQGSVSFLGVYIARNCGIFAEAPMFAFVLSLAFIYEAFFDKANHRWKYIIIFAVALLTTTSTTGLIVMILTLAMFIVVNVNWKIRSVLLVVLVPVLLVTFSAVLQSKTQNMGGSVDIRTEDIIAGFRSWITAPFFGHGLEASDSYMSYISFARTFYANGNSGYSSGFMTVLMQGGIYFALLWVGLPLVLFGRKSLRSFATSVLLALITMFSIVTGVFLFSALIVLLYVLGIVSTDDEARMSVSRNRNEGV